MHLLIIGAAGMIGRKLVARLAAEPDCFGFDVDRLTLADVVEPLAPEPLKDVTTTKTLSLADPGAAESLVSGQQDTGRPDVIVHLAAIVSGEAEADFEKGYMINLDGSRFLLRRSARKVCVNPIVRDWFSHHLSPYTVNLSRRKSATNFI